MLAILLALALPLLPNATITPGKTVDVPVATLCRPGYSSRVRHVSEATKREVFHRYGLPQSGAFEVDHLISLELGGSNDISNLWPQSYTTLPFNARKKDALENRLHHLVCTGQLTLPAAQDAIRRDWIAAYKRFLP